MRIEENDYYNRLSNWSFDDINYTEEIFTNWIYEEKIKEHINEFSKILDLGTAAGEQVLKNFPDCAEILGTDSSMEMIKSANQNLINSGRKNITFKVMDNLKMDTPNNYFDLVTARHTKINPIQIYKTLKPGGCLIVRGVDKLDCWELKYIFKKGQGYKDLKPISLIDYENIIDAGFKNVELVPIHIREYYKTKEDLIALLLKTPILIDFSEENENNNLKLDIDMTLLDKYINSHKTNKGILLIRRYYGITAKKNL